MDDRPSPSNRPSRSSSSTRSPPASRPATPWRSVPRSTSCAPGPCIPASTSSSSAAAWGTCRRRSAAGREAGGSSILDVVFLPNVHPGARRRDRRYVPRRGRRRSRRDRDRDRRLDHRGRRRRPQGRACPPRRAASGRRPRRQGLPPLRRTRSSEVEAAVEIGAGRIAGAPGLVARVIAQLHDEMAVNLAADARFGRRVQGAGGTARTGCARVDVPIHGPTRLAVRRQGR